MGKPLSLVTLTLAGTLALINSSNAYVRLAELSFHRFSNLQIEIRSRNIKVAIVYEVVPDFLPSDCDFGIEQVILQSNNHYPQPVVQI